MEHPVKEPRIEWGSRGFADHMAAAATEELPTLALLMDRLAELARVKGLWNEDTLKYLYGLAGCMLALDRPADALGAADLLASKQAQRLTWGEMYASNAHAIRSYTLSILGDKKTAYQARRRIGQPMPESAAETKRSWNETLRFYRADIKRMQEDREGLAQVLEACSIQADLVKSLLTAPPEFEGKLAKIRNELKAYLRALLERQAVSPSQLTPVKPDRKKGIPALPEVFQPRDSDPKLVRQFKERILAYPSFKSERMLQMIIELAWMLYALDRPKEALAITEAVLDYHMDDERFTLNTEEGMAIVRLSALLCKQLGGGPRLAEHRAILEKLAEISQQVRKRNRRISRGELTAEEVWRVELEQMVPRRLAEAWREKSRPRTFVLLRYALDTVADALVRESYGGLSEERVRGYLMDGLNQFRDRIAKGR